MATGRRQPLAALLALTVFAGCRGDDGAQDADSPPPARPEITAAALRNTTYASPYLEEGTVRLVDGVFQDPARRVVVSLLPEYAVGDLDGDAAPDAVVVLATNTGGTGTFHDLYFVRNTERDPRGTISRFLGDRVPVDRVRIVNGVIELDMTMHGPADPMCCPTVSATRRFRLEDGELEEIEPPLGSTGFTP